jgi:hypothetical protein
MILQKELQKNFTFSSVYKERKFRNRTVECSGFRSLFSFKLMMIPLVTGPHNDPVEST